MALAANLSPIWRGSALVLRRSTPSFSPTPIRTISAACCPPLVRQAYPNATVFLPTRERAYWLATSTFDNASDRGRRNVLLVRRVLANCAAQISGVDDEEVIAGIRPCPLPGHTPGHTGYRLEAGDTSLLIWGDIVHFRPFRPPRSRSVAFDVDPEQARRTREILLRQAASEQWLIAGMHLGLPGFARVERHRLIVCVICCSRTMTTVKPRSRPQEQAGRLCQGRPLTAALPAFFYFCSWLWWRPTGDVAESTEDPGGRAGRPAFVTQRLTSCNDHKNAPEK